MFSSKLWVLLLSVACAVVAGIFLVAPLADVAEPRLVWVGGIFLGAVTLVPFANLGGRYSDNASKALYLATMSAGVLLGGALGNMFAENLLVENLVIYAMMVAGVVAFYALTAVEAFANHHERIFVAVITDPPADEPF